MTDEEKRIVSTSLVHIKKAIDEIQRVGLDVAIIADSSDLEIETLQALVLCKRLEKLFRGCL